MSELERRYLTLDVAEVRADGEDDPKIVGYAAMFNRYSEDLGGFREQIQRGAFKRSLAEGADVRALVDHDPSRILGRNTAGTLKIKEDREGLRVEIVPPDTTVGRDAVVSLRRGDISGMSFGFRTVTDKWNKVDGENVRTLVDVDLFDVSVVTYPAYPDTAVAVRSRDLWEGETEPTGSRQTMRMRLALADAV